MNALCLLLLFASAAGALEPAGWERKKLESTPVSILVPTGSQQQTSGHRHPGFDETHSGWQLQSMAWPERGAARMILYLQRGDITIYYSRNAPESKYKTLDDYLESETNGRKAEAEQYGQWQGHTIRLLALRDPNRHPSADEPFGDLAMHAVELGPSEYLVISLHAHPDAVPGYLPYFYKVRDSLEYSKPTLLAKRPPRSAKRKKPAQAEGHVDTYEPEPDTASPDPSSQPPVEYGQMPPGWVPGAPPGRWPPPPRSLILLPHLGTRPGGPYGFRGGALARTGRNYYPYVRVLQCPQGFAPFPSAWPRRGAFVCRPIRVPGQ